MLSEASELQHSVYAPTCTNSENGNVTTTGIQTGSRSGDHVAFFEKIVSRVSKKLVCLASLVKAPRDESHAYEGGGDEGHPVQAEVEQPYEPQSCAEHRKSNSQLKFESQNQRA